MIDPAVDTSAWAFWPEALRTPRPTETPKMKMTPASTTAHMNRKTSCFPLSWISWKF